MSTLFYFDIIVGTVLPKRGGEGAPRTVRTVVLEENILEAVADDPSMSIRNLSEQFHTSKSTIHRIIREQLLHPFHIQKVHAMTPQDFPARLEYANWFMDRQREDMTFINRVLFTDEAGFSRDGVINSHNLHIWAEENPHGILQTKHQRKFNVNVWAGIIGNHLIGPFVLQDRLNGERYLEFIQNDLNGLLEHVPLQTRRDMWFMHDGAPPHFSLIVRDHLNHIFHNRWIGRGGPYSWPSRSPDLNPLDFFLWGHLKSLVYATPIHTRDALLNRITLHCEAIRNDPGMLFQVQRGCLRRLRKCIEREGGHIEQFL